MSGEYLTRKAAANFLTKEGYPINARSLANLASNNNAGNGPAFTRMGWGAPVQYHTDDLIAWAKMKRQKVPGPRTPEQQRDIEIRLKQIEDTLARAGLFPLETK